MIVDDSFSRLTTRMIVRDSFSVSCFGNHWPNSGQKTCSRPLSSRKIHTFTSLSYGTPFSIHDLGGESRRIESKGSYECCAA